jgi:hypothetical protein
MKRTFLLPLIDRVKKGALTSALKARSTRLWIKSGFFVTTVCAVLILVQLSSSWIDRVKNSAMQFVPVDALSFIVIPDVNKFLTSAAPSILRSVRAFMDSSTLDLVSLLVPVRIGPNVSVPPQCRVIQEESDLEPNGIDPASSFSVAYLDHGTRFALKFSDESRGLAFISDIFFPMYVELRADGLPEQINNKTPEVTFHLIIDARNIDLCLDKDRRNTTTGSVQKTATNLGRTLRIPIRLNAGQDSASVRVECKASIIGVEPQPCSCSLLRIRTGHDSIDEARECNGATINLSKELEDLKKWKLRIGNKETIQIGDSYVAKLFGFHVIEQMRVGEISPLYRLSASLMPITRDDSFLKHFRRFAQNGAAFETTLYGGSRPDTVVAIKPADFRFFPLYLMTPVGIHFKKEQIRLEFVTNLEPKDMALVQALAARGEVAALQKNWTKWPSGFAATMTDSSLKFYAHFLRIFGANFEDRVADFFPLFPLAIDIMEEGARSIIVSITQWDENNKTWRLAVVVPDVSPEYAVHLVELARQRLLERQAKWIIDRAARSARSANNDPDDPDFIKHVVKFTCPQGFWSLRSIEPVKDAKGNIVGFNPDIDFNGRELKEQSQSWSSIEENVKVEFLAPREDPNAYLWGRANSGQSYVTSDAENIKNLLTKFTEAVNSIQSNLHDTSKPMKERRALINAVAELVQSAVKLENERSSLRDIRLAQTLSEISKLSNVNIAGQKLGELVGGDFVNEHATMNEEDVATFCKTNKNTALPLPKAYYDVSSSVLYNVEVVKDIYRPVNAPLDTISAASTNGTDSGGKLGIDINTILFGPILNKSEGATSAGKTEDIAKRFPFPNIRFYLTGRDTGNGVQGALVLNAVTGNAQ